MIFLVSLFVWLLLGFAGIVFSVWLLQEEVDLQIASAMTILGPFTLIISSGMYVGSFVIPKINEKLVRKK